MRPGTFEMIIGAKRDPHFGPVVMVGHGGIFVEIMEKISLRLAPVTSAEVDQMIDELPGSKAFHGVRGLPPMNLEALKDAIIRVSWLMSAFPEIDQLDINPFIVSDSQAYALDARIFLK
jgi:succinyl-CoA synthetase beta subunit